MIENLSPVRRSSSNSWTGRSHRPDSDRALGAHSGRVLNVFLDNTDPDHVTCSPTSSEQLVYPLAATGLSPPSRTDPRESEACERKSG
jgi:hypothetical protein